MDYKKMDGEFILNWCKENKQEEWLKDAVAKYGKNFLSIKRAFCVKFFPNIVPKAKPKAPSFFDLVAKL